VLYKESSFVIGTHQHSPPSYPYTTTQLAGNKPARPIAKVAETEVSVASEGEVIKSDGTVASKKNHTSLATIFMQLIAPVREQPHT
jgi:hypothetical protein